MSRTDGGRKLPDRQRIEANAAQLADVWGDGIPEWNDDTCAKADDARGGVIHFHTNGILPTPVGRHGIAWDGPHHRHQEWRAQLNRFGYIALLASGYRATGDEDYARAARDYIEGWIAAHPTTADWRAAPYDSVLNICIRLGQGVGAGWLGTLPVFFKSPVYDDAFVTALIESALAQLAYLRRHIAPEINWRIANANGLLVGGLLLDPLAEALALRDFAVRVLNDAFVRQVLPDGCHYERNPGYHHWMTTVMERCWLLDRAMPELGLSVDAQTVALMFDYSLASTAPNGSWNALHDCQGVQNPKYTSPAMKARADFRARAGLPDELPPPSRCFPDAGQALLRTDWTPQADYMTFDATLFGGCHFHPGRNGIQFHVKGRPMLVDPGYLSYEASDPMSAHGRSTRAHNTLNLNGWNQSPSDPTDTRAFSAVGYDVVASEYTGGYWCPADDGMHHAGDGIWGNHQRSLVWVHGRFALVIDNFTRNPIPATRPQPSIEINWQFNEGPVVLDAARKIVHTAGDGPNLLMLFPLGAEGFDLSLHEGERAPLRGWMPSLQGYAPAPQLVVEQKPMPQTWLDMATVLIPFEGATPPAVRTRMFAKTNDQRYWKLVLEWADGTSDTVVWNWRLCQMIGDVDGMSTDASLLHLRRDSSGEGMGGAAFGGTYLFPYERGTTQAGIIRF